MADGQLVFTKLNGRWTLCKVESAVDDTARVMNKLKGIDTWVHISELRKLETILNGNR